MPRVAVLVLVASACTVGEPPAGADADAGRALDAAPRSDAGRRPDAAIGDGEVPFDCDPLATGIFVAGNDLSDESAPRVLATYDPNANTLTEIADVRSCIEGWYVRAMAVSRDGVVHFLLANQTIAAYRIGTGSCEVHPLSRSADDGLYSLAAFAGDGSGSISPADERLFVTFRSYDERDPEILLELDRSTYAETVLGSIAVSPAILVSLTGTADGRLFATRGRFDGERHEHDVVRIGTDASISPVVAMPPRPPVWFRTAIALWESRAFVFDAALETPPIESTVVEADFGAGTWSETLMSVADFELQAVSTTTCVSVTLI